ASKAQNGNSSQPLQYEFKDNLPLTKTWYQLRQVDVNGSEGYSNMVEVTIFPEEGVNINLFPNPTNKDLNVLISANQADTYVLTLADLTGKVITTEKIKAGIGNTYHTFNVEKLPQGMYLMSVTSRISGNVFTQKWVKF
ncbi:MAG: T9SS type A sorting domain-containing protein, partial [Bacteroidia bacterium]